MRVAALIFALLGAGALAASASAVPGQPDKGFLVLKDMHGYAVTEVREKATGRVVAKEIVGAVRDILQRECLDPRHRNFGARWPSSPTYRINMSSLEGIAANGDGDMLSAAAVADQVRAGFQAWGPTFRTTCSSLGPSRFTAIEGPATTTPASLIDLVPDGENAVEFRLLAGTFCEGAIACTIVDFERRRILEVDMIFEKDLLTIGFGEFWTTGPTTALNFQIAVIDVATHEVGHFAGLDHVNRSPQLTMYPLIHDGMETLGLGDMLGILLLR